MILDEIVASTKRLLPERKAGTPLAEIERAAAGQRPPRDFAAALREPSIRLIAEVKRASPSKGQLAPNLDAAALAKTYKKAGAAAISVLTEAEYFKGSLADLEAVRKVVDLPILRKDFIIDPYQVYEARAAGADAVLLIAAILEPEEMRHLLEKIHSLGMKALVEVHNREELKQVLKLKPEVIGINNRNLLDFSVSLETTIALRPLVPNDVVLVSESGIHTREDVERLEKTGVNAILVGEALVTSSDPSAKIQELLGK
ncbi:MAG: indole-3-glycerol phosphate synthase TrpC [Dehalococcoidia bacterium]